MKCLICKGQGRVPKLVDDSTVICRACNGSGQIDLFSWIGFKIWDIKANRILKKVKR